MSTICFVCDTCAVSTYELELSKRLYLNCLADSKYGQLQIDIRVYYRGVLPNRIS